MHCLQSPFRNGTVTGLNECPHLINKHEQCVEEREGIHGINFRNGSNYNGSQWMDKQINNNIGANLKTKPKENHERNSIMLPT